MQGLWGCAYEMRNLGDVNYKITESLTCANKLVSVSDYDRYN
jgi:hypothetical protein